jgi:hypothetical protein
MSRGRGGEGATIMKIELEETESGRGMGVKNEQSSKRRYMGLIGMIATWLQRLCE